MLKIVKPSEIDSVLGTEVGVSDWVTIDQERIDKFADATMDHQFIHVDPEQATPVFGSTIAHGFLVLSLAPKMLEDTYVVKSAKMGVNYGLNRVRFTAPVPVNSDIRARVTLKSFEKMDNARGKGARLVVSLAFELKESERPACVADLVFLIYE